MQQRFGGVMGKKLKDGFFFYICVVEEVVQWVSAMAVKQQRISGKLESPEHGSTLFGIPMLVLVAWEAFNPPTSSYKDGASQGVSGVEVYVDFGRRVEKSANYFVLGVLKDIVYERLCFIQHRIDVCSSLDE
jgi:hypothetical protein